MIEREKVLGKIDFVEIGTIHDRPALFGAIFGLSMKNTSIIFEKVVNMQKSLKNPSEWNTNRAELLIELNEYIYELLQIANVRTVDKLVGIPVEITYRKGIVRQIESFRILTEVL